MSVFVGVNSCVIQDHQEQRSVGSNCAINPQYRNYGDLEIKRSAELLEVKLPYHFKKGERVKLSGLAFEKPYFTPSVMPFPESVSYDELYRASEKESHCVGNYFLAIKNSIKGKKIVIALAIYETSKQGNRYMPSSARIKK